MSTTKICARFLFLLLSKICWLPSFFSHLIIGVVTFARFVIMQMMSLAVQECQQRMFNKNWSSLMRTSRIGNRKTGIASVNKIAAFSGFRNIKMYINYCHSAFKRIDKPYKWLMLSVFTISLSADNFFSFLPFCFFHCHNSGSIVNIQSLCTAAET